MKIKLLIVHILTCLALNYPQPIITNSVVVGGVTSTSARFWIKISESAEINIEASTSEMFTASLKGTPIVVTSGFLFSGIINISTLQPDTKYFYRVLINDIPADNQVRYFRSFPVEGSLSNFSFAFGSCQQSGGGLPSPTPPGNVYREILNHSPAFFLHLGDWGYPDTTDFIPFNNSFFSAVYSNVQTSYSNRYSPSYPMDSLLRTMSVDYVFDDHDFMNNNSSALSSSFYVPFRPSILGEDFILLEISNPAGARENSIRGYKENFPGYPIENESRGIYHKFIYGNAEFFALDLRSQRSSNLDAIQKNTLTSMWEYNPPAGHSILSGAKAPGSGETQLEWFINGLRNSTAEWKFIISSVPFNRAQSAAIDIGLALQDSVLDAGGLLPPGTTGIFAAMEFVDKWVGYQSDLDSVLNIISSENINNVIILSGDSHTAAIDDGANAGLPEIMAGNLDITNSQMASLFAEFELDIWNKGGQGISTSEFNNAFGKVNVHGSDSVTLALIDEFGSQFASHTVYNQVVSVDPEISGIPESISLLQNFPNPFNPKTTIRYKVNQTSAVSLSIYDVLGNEVLVLVDEGKQEPGEYNFTVDGSNLVSGVYYYRLVSGSFSKTKMMVLLK